MNLPKYRISPNNYVIQRRMTEAKWSLTNTELSQAEISGVWVMKMSITLPNCFAPCQLFAQRLP